VAPWQLIGIAIALDLLLGDPPWSPHPVRWMGKAISILEKRFRRLPVPLVVSGLLFSVTLITGTWILYRILLLGVEGLHPFAADALEVLLLYFSLSARSLADAALAVLKPLQRRSLQEARKAVSMIVGRDVTHLDQDQIAGAAVESVAENLVDGVVSPLFYAAIGGAPLALAFKMVNTLDSMIGYRNETYRDFGKAAARMDDAANFIPSRIAVPVIALAAQMLSRNGKAALKTAFREGSRHLSPNSGFPEAAFAGTLGIALGGPSRYGGNLVSKPHIGIGLGTPAPGHIQKACDLMLLSGILWGVLTMFLSAFRNL